METKTTPIKPTAEKKRLREAAEAKARKQPFPPRRDYASLSLRDLLDAREAYHVYLSSLDNVVATAIGRYRIHERDWYATHAPDHPRPEDQPRVKEPRTLANSIVKPWSWPAVLVFVKEWETRDRLADDVVPRTLYLPDGRVVPTCVILATPDEQPPPPVTGPTQASSLLGGGYSCIREHQGETAIGSFGCLVKKDGTYYALTSRHVAGSADEVVRAVVHGTGVTVGVTSGIGLGRVLMSDVFPTWPGERTYLNVDAGLVRVDRIDDWTAQVFGIGEIGEAFDATESNLTLDLIGCPVRAYGGTSGVMEGEIQALFFRYESMSGFDHTTDVLIGPRTGAHANGTAPFTRPGDSGTLWFYDPPRSAPEPHEDVDVHARAERGKRARRLHVVAMQWGGERTRAPDGKGSAYALGTFVSTILGALDVQLVRDWSTGHDEYWGKLGHFAIGWKACDALAGKLEKLMRANQDRIGYDNDRLSDGSEFRQGRDGFVPLADVPDYVWVNSRPNEPIQHFADIDIKDIDGGPSLLERGVQDPSSIAASVWKEYFDGFAAKGVGPDEGCLPFRVWQLWDLMVERAKKKDVTGFVAAAGVLGHYVGDASQPLHCSYLHHGRLPTIEVSGREYPIPKNLPGSKQENPKYTAFKKTRPAKIHGIYEETMLEVDTLSALTAVDGKVQGFTASGRGIRSGHDAAAATLALMHGAQQRLSPETIIDADDPELTANQRAAALWKNDTVRNATIESLADSVKLLAELWTSAWKAGGGDEIADSKLSAIDEDELDALYRDKNFAPSLSLAAMVKSKRFEPTANDGGDRKPPPGAAARSPRGHAASRRNGEQSRERP
jgi:hypothetical protein